MVIFQPHYLTDPESWEFNPLDLLVNNEDDRTLRIGTFFQE